MGRGGCGARVSMLVLAAGDQLPWPGSACTTTTVTSSSGASSPRPRSGGAATASQTNAKARARARVDLAAGYFRNGQMSVALEEAKRAVQIDPTLLTPYGLLGLIYTELDDRRQARTTSNGPPTRTGQPHINNNYGWCCPQWPRAGGPMDYFQRALRDPLYATPSLANLNAACA